MARPSEFSQETADAICEMLIEGKSLRLICREESMPACSTVFRWLTVSKEFQEQYARAREVQADTIFDEILDIADDGTNDYVTKTNSDGEDYQALDHEHITRSRLRVDARKWMAGKLQPKKYGERSTVELEGEIGVRRKITEMSDDDLAAIASAGRNRNAPEAESADIAD